MVRCYNKKKWAHARHVFTQGIVSSRPWVGEADGILFICFKSWQSCNQSAASNQIIKYICDYSLQIIFVFVFAEKYFHQLVSTVIHIGICLWFGFRILYFYMWQVTRDMWHVTGDTWQVTHETWYMTHNTWHIVWDEHFLKNFSSLALAVWDWQCLEYISTNHYLGKKSIESVIMIIRCKGGGAAGGDHTRLGFFMLQT